MPLLQSESMHFYQFTCFKDNAPKAIQKFGALGSVQFVDLNKGEQAFNLTYAREVQRCQDTLRNLMILVKESEDWGVVMKAPVGVEEMEEGMRRVESEPGQTNSSLFDDVEEEIQK